MGVSNEKRCKIKYRIIIKHKSEDYKISAVEYYLVEDKSQEEVC